MVTGWLLDGLTWYYLSPAGGAMATGWVWDGSAWYYMAPSGALTTGWVKEGGSWYYLDPSQRRDGDRVAPDLGHVVPLLEWRASGSAD